MPSLRERQQQFCATVFASAGAPPALELGDARGIPFLLDVMENGDAAQARRDAFEHFAAHVESDLPFHAEGNVAARSAEVSALRAWWQSHAASIYIK